MHDAGTDMAEIHLPERWAVLEQALRQMRAEDSTQYPGDARNGENPDGDQSPHHDTMR